MKFVADNELPSPIKLCKQQLHSYNGSSITFVFSMLSLGRILISNLAVANLLIYSLSGMILLYLVTPFYTEGVFG